MPSSNLTPPKVPQLSYNLSEFATELPQISTKLRHVVRIVIGTTRRSVSLAPSDYDIQILFNETHYLKPFVVSRICKQFSANCQKWDYLFMTTLVELLRSSQGLERACYLFLEDDSQRCEADELLDELCVRNQGRQDLMVFGFGGSGWMISQADIPRLLDKLLSVEETTPIDLAIGQAFRCSRFNRALYIEHSASNSTIGNKRWDDEFRACSKPQFDGGIAFWTHYDYKLDAENDFSPCTNCSRISPYKHTNKTSFYGLATNCHQFCLSANRTCSEDVNYNSLDYLLQVEECRRIEYVGMFFKEEKERMPIFRTSEKGQYNFDPHDERGTCYWNELYRYRCDLDSLTEQRICFCES